MPNTKGLHAVGIIHPPPNHLLRPTGLQHKNEAKAFYAFLSQVYGAW